jgi:uncharacterized protein (DUF2141 family)
MKTMPLDNNLLNSKIVKSFSLLAFNLLIAFQAYASQPLKIKPHEAPDACDANKAQIRVTVNGVDAGGILNVGLYNDPDNFLFKKGRKRTVRIPAIEKQHTVCMNLEQPGTYAVAAYHDLDANRKLKIHWNMIPDEPFGLSNNPEPKDSFPKFSDSAFTTDKLGADIVINLRQP